MTRPQSSQEDFLLSEEKTLEAQSPRVSLVKDSDVVPPVPPQDSSVSSQAEPAQVSDSQPAKPQKRSRPPKPDRYIWLSQHRLVRRVAGIPVLDPPVPWTRMFHFWAALFGPLFYLPTGMWRKGLLLCLIWIVLHPPSTLIGTAFFNPGVLLAVLSEAYAPHYASVVVLTILGSLLFCKGKYTWALCSVVLVGLILVNGEYYYDPLPMDRVSAFLWINAMPIWEGLVRITAFCILSLNILALPFALLTGAVFWYAGLPVYLLMYSLPGEVFAVFCGMMATYDMYRTRILKEKFFW